MSNKKYNIELNDEPPNDELKFLKFREVNNVRAEISSIRFTEDTKGRIKPNGEYLSVGEPKIEVSFQTGETSFTSDFVLDPLASDRSSYSRGNRFTSLVSSAYVEWGEFDDIIGSSVTLRSPYDSSNVLIQNPLKSHNYSILSQIESSYFYREGLSNFFVDVFVSWVSNKSYGRAEIEDFEVKINKRVRVRFKLKSGDSFARTFRIIRRDNQRKNLGIRGISGNRIYDFWDLCEDSIGYIPSNSDYTQVIGEELPISYNCRWVIQK